MSYINRPPALSGNVNTWAERLNDWLVKNQDKLSYYLAGQSAAEDGILMWDRDNSQVVVSSNGSWVALTGGGGGGTITNYLRDDADDSTSFRLTMGGLTVDTDTLYVDSVNNEVGIGTTTPSEKLEVVGNVEATEFIGDLRGAVVFKAQAGEALTKGDVVYISGISGQTTVVSKADADDAAKMPAFGLAAINANNNASLEVYTFGTLSGLDTSSYTEGDELFVGTTAGALVSAAPAGEGSLVQKIGKVTRSHASSGSVKIMGAGRTNATPNLNDGNIFIGNSSNQAVTASLATQVSTLETSHSDVVVDGDFTSEGLMKRGATSGSYSIVTDNSSNWNTAHGWGNHASAGYLTAETNDLSTTVTWANVPDANITETSVTQHQAALSITESQISDLGTYLTASDITGKADLSGAAFTGDVSVAGTVTADALTVDTDTLYVDATNDRVGIGTNSPNSALHVTTSGSALQQLLRLESSSGTRAFIGSTLIDDTYLSLYDGSGDLKIRFTTDNNDSYISGGGNFGIGTDNPATELDVDGTITANGISLGDSESIAVGADDDFTIAHDGTDTTIQNDTGDLIVDVNSSSGEFVLKNDSTDVVKAQDNYFQVLLGQSIPVLTVLTDRVQFSKKITFIGNQTVDGRDVSVDGAKLDTIESNATADQTGAEIKTAYEAEANTNAFTDAEKTKLSSIQERTIRTRFQRRGYSNTVGFLTLTNTLQNVGSVFRLNADVTTAVEHILDLNISANFLDINSTNDGEFIVAVTAPAPSNETTVNLGTVISTTSTGSTFQFVLSGDVTKHFSPYCGMSINSDGSSAFGFNNNDGWFYDPTTDRTTVDCYAYQANKPTTGDTVYLHPFDWETSGTVLNGDTYPIEAYNASGTTNQNQFHQIYLGYYKDDKSFQIKAREVTTSENIQLSRISGTYSNIIGI